MSCGIVEVVNVMLKSYPGYKGNAKGEVEQSFVGDGE